jgi:predicted AAA+ superfamily ATPase
MLATIRRGGHLSEVKRLLRHHPVVGILGARQVGKTTLAAMVASRWRRQVTRFDLEDFEHRARLADPKLALQELKGLVVLDEAQHLPELFPILRVLADRAGTPARFLLLGSASPERARRTSESRAGRISYHRLRGFALDEVGARAAATLWLRGGFPRAFLAASDRDAAEWLRGFVATFLARDIPQLGVTIPSETLGRFWRMLAHWHGQQWSASELGRSFGVADHTVRRYLDLLAGAFVVRVLPPWSENLAKRQVKAPKVYIADSGLLHALLGVASMDDLLSHPKVGASWEGFAIEEAIAHTGARPEECFFWATHAGAELDLFLTRGRQRVGFEVKRTTAPRVTPSMRAALADLRLDRLCVIHAGRESFPLGDRITAVPLVRLRRDVAPLA